MKRGQATKGKTVFGSNVLLLALGGPPRPGPDTGEWREHGQLALEFSSRRGWASCLEFLE